MIRTDQELLDEIIRAYKNSPSIYHPSKYWEYLNKVNLKQLVDEGYANFKQTVNLNYFNFIAYLRSDQFRWLLSNTPPHKYSPIFFRSRAEINTDKLSRFGKLIYKFFVSMLWEYASSIDTERLLDSLAEPLEGNPFRVYYRGRLVSQDLANSLIEYYSITKSSNLSLKNQLQLYIAELGAGYGRTAYLFLNRFPNAKYFVIDIPPALFISQKYLSNIFKNKKIFKFREFTNFGDVKSEMLSSSIIFLLPHQLEQLPRKIFNLFINISSLHEMRPEQIKNYLNLIDKLTMGYFYSKQWYTSRIPFEDITITARDYPIPTHWEEIFFRPARPQRRFFEALYKIR